MGDQRTRNHGYFLKRVFLGLRDDDGTDDWLYFYLFNEAYQAAQFSINMQFESKGIAKIGIHTGHWSAAPGNFGLDICWSTINSGSRLWKHAKKADKKVYHNMFVSAACYEEITLHKDTEGMPRDNDDNDHEWDWRHHFDPVHAVLQDAKGVCAKYEKLIELEGA